MKNFWQKICIGGFYLYFLMVCFFFIPYYNWNYAKTHGFMKWLFLGEVVATAKAIVWPYYVLSNPVEHHDSPDATHFINSKKAYEEALIIINEVGDVSKLPADKRTVVADFLRLSINEANKVQPSYLQESHKDYLKMYEEKYKNGISTILKGIETDNTALLLKGAFACNEFSDWIHEHKSEFSH